MIWPFKRHTWKYVGKVSGETILICPDTGRTISHKSGWWVLSENEIGTRKAKLVGDPGESRHARVVAADVLVWTLGCGLPCVMIDNVADAEKQYKPLRDFVVINGGKGK